MARQRVVVRHSGRWERHEYIDGDDQLVNLPFGMLSRETLLDEIYEFMETSRSNVRYTLSYLLKEASGRTLKGLLKTDDDLAGLLQEQDDPIVYVTEKIIQETPRDVDELSHGDENYARGFVERVRMAESAERRRVALFSPKHSGPSVSTSHLEGPSRSHWSIPMIEVDKASEVVHCGPSEPESGSLVLGSKFLQKDELIFAVRRWHIGRHAKYVVARSSKSRLEILCKQKEKQGCPFRLYAAPKDGCWRVQKFEDYHTCRLVLDLTMTCNEPRKKAKYV